MKTQDKNTDSGIYNIVNTADNKVYVGSSSRLKTREREHFNSLRRGDHSNIHLQRAYDIHGSFCFRFQVLELCPEEFLQVREQFYLDKVPLSHRYNISRNAYTPEPLSIKIAQYSLHGVLLRTWSSIRKAAREVGVDNKTLAAACKGVNDAGGKCISAAGFQWRTFEDTPLPGIDPAPAALRRHGKTWPDYWRSGEYDLYVWDLSGRLLTVSNNIFEIAKTLEVKVNSITRVLRRERNSLKGCTFSLDDPEFPGYDVSTGYANGVKLRLKKLYE